jgi:hypothetical protein
MVAVRFVARFGSVVAVVCLAACGRSEEPEQVGRSVQAVVTAASVVPGYSHTLGCSRFRIGQSVTPEISAPDFQRWRGSLGAFAVDPSNGSVKAILNADSPRGPYILDEATQGAQVQAYFVGCGLPADQIARVDVTYHLIGSGPGSGSTPDSGAIVANGQPVLTSLNSILRRSVHGVFVVDSTAWAKMTTAGAVDMESVFWPPLPTAIVTSAVNFATTMQGSAQYAAYVAKLPGTIQEAAGVVLRHSDASIHSTPTAYVSFDARFVGEGTTRHFDQNGVEFRLPNEVNTMPSDVHPPRTDAAQP